MHPGLPGRLQAQERGATIGPTWLLPTSTPLTPNSGLSGACRTRPALSGPSGTERPARPLNPAELGLVVLEDAFVIRSHGTMQQGYRVRVRSTSDLPRGLQPLAEAVQNNVHARLRA